jgi:hypothetical protein
MLVILTCGGTPCRGHDRPGAGAARAEHHDHLGSDHDDHFAVDHDDRRAAGVDRRQSAPLGDRG